MDVFFALACLLFVMGLWRFDRKIYKNQEDIDDLKEWHDKLEDRIIRLQKKNKTLETAIKSLSKKNYIVTAEKKESELIV